MEQLLLFRTGLLVFERKGTSKQFIVKSSSDSEHIEESRGCRNQGIYTLIENLDKTDATSQGKLFLDNWKLVAVEFLFREDSKE